MATVEVVGVDGTRRGWIAILLADGRFTEARFFPESGGLLQAFTRAVAIAVDIPIGLPARERRHADKEARRVLESRRNSVFFVPPRSALEAPTFKKAVRVARSLNSSVSLQIYALRHKIFEVDGPLFDCLLQILPLEKIVYPSTFDLARKRVPALRVP